MIFSRTPLEWRMHSAAGLQRGESGSPSLEVLKTIRYLVYASWAEQCDSEG